MVAKFLDNNNRPLYLACMFCFPNTGPVINTLKSCLFQISSYPKGQVPLGPSTRKQNIQAKEVYRELEQRRRRRQQERQKTNRFRLVKQKLCTCITPFCTFRSLRCSTGTWILDFTRPLYGGRWTQKKIFFSSSSKLRYDPFGFNPRRFPQH